MNKQHNIGEVYAQYLVAENEKNNQERYVGKEHFYHASGAGMCSRKLYFQSVDKTQPTNIANPASMRKMRLGTIVHNDIQNALILNNNINNNNINNNNINNKYKYNIVKSHFVVEGEICIDELNVRGFYDVLEVVGSNDKDASAVYLYDIKTAANYSFQKVFNDKQNNNRMEHHELQVATYGYALKEIYGRLDGIYVMYYNKDTSTIKYSTLPLSMLSRAYMFWANINKQHAKGLPNFEDGVSPVMRWECDYCNFYSHCNPPDNLGKYNIRHNIRVI